MDEALPEGLFPGASLDAEFRKSTPPRNAFSPYYSWDGHLAMDVTIVRQGRGALAFSSMFQTVGTANINKRVGVGGTGYLLGLRYVHTRSKVFQLSSGLSHFSSHLTRDLDDKTDQNGQTGPRFHASTIRPNTTCCTSADTGPCTAVRSGRSWSWPFNRSISGSTAGEPTMCARFIWEPDGPSGEAAIGPSWLKRSRESDGTRSVNVSLVLALHPRNQAESPFQVFVSEYPGGEVRVSPDWSAPWRTRISIA